LAVVVAEEVPVLPLAVVVSGFGVETKGGNAVTFFLASSPEEGNSAGTVCLFPR